MTFDCSNSFKCFQSGVSHISLEESAGHQRVAHREANTRARWIDALPSGPKHRPEGLVVTKETDKTTELIVLHDGVAGGDPTKCVLEWKK